MTALVPRLLRRTSVLAVAAAVLAASFLTATPAHAARVDKPLSLTAAPKAGSIPALGDVGINISWTGCFVYSLRVEELIGGAWRPVGELPGTRSAGSDQVPCATPTSRATVSLAYLLGQGYELKKTSLSVGHHTLRVSGKGYYHDMPDGDRWSMGAGVSNQFQLTITKAKTTFTGWSKKTMTVKPGASVTLPALSIANPGSYDNVVVLEANQGFGWFCVTYACDSYPNQSRSNATVTPTASSRRITTGKNYTLQTQFRYRVLPNAYVTGGTSPVITVKFTKGISKSKSTKTTLSKSGTQQYGKKQATLKATVTSKKATGLVSFLVYKKSRIGSYELVESYAPFLTTNLKKGKATYKFGKSVLKKGSYVVVARFQTKKPSKYRDSISKPVKLTVK